MNLMLTRFSERQREFGMCSALGASRARLVREALAETLLLGLAASIAGLLLAHALVELVTNYLPDAFLTRTLTPVALSWRAVAVTSALGILAAAIAGVVPAWMATKVDAIASIRLAGRSGTEVPARRRLARGLLVAEVALATTLLAGAGLLVRTFVNLTNADRGLNSDGVITGWVALPEFTFRDRASRLAFAERARDATASAAGRPDGQPERRCAADPRRHLFRQPAARHGGRRPDQARRDHDLQRQRAVLRAVRHQAAGRSFLLRSLGTRGCDRRPAPCPPAVARRAGGRPLLPP